MRKIIAIIFMIGLALASEGSEGSLKYNVNGVGLGMHRSLVEKKFKRKSSKSLESNQIEHFGSSPGYTGYADGTWVRFDKQQLVVTVIGVNLYDGNNAVYLESEERLSGERRLKKSFGKPIYSELKDSKGTKFRLDYYRNSLMVKTQAKHPDYGVMFYLGKVASEDI